MKELRLRAPLSHCKELVAVAGRAPSPSPTPIQATKLNQLQHLLSRSPYDFTNFFTQLNWSICQLERFATELVSFQRLQRDLETATFSGNSGDAHKILDQCRNELGYSGWWINASIAVRQIFDGQTIQKEFAKEIIATSRGLPIAIAYLSSHRNESAVSLAGFIPRAEKAIIDWEVREPWAKYLRRFSSPTTFESERDAALSLSVAETGSFIDLFLAMNDVLLELFEFSNPTQSTIAIKNRFEKLRLANQHHQTDFSALLQSIPATTEASTADAASSLIEQMLAYDKKSISASLELRKLSVNFSFLELGSAIRAYLSRVVEPRPLQHSKLITDLNDRLRMNLTSVWAATKHSVDEASISSLSVSQPTTALANNPTILQLLDAGGLNTIVASKHLYASKLGQGNWQDAVTTAVRCISPYPGSRQEFRLSDVLLARNWQGLKSITSPVDLSLALHYARLELPPGRHSQKLLRHLQQASLLVLAQNACSTYSELATKQLDVPTTEFLREICIEPVMSVNTRIRSSRALSEERMLICQNLVVKDPQNASEHQAEIRRITYQLELERGVQHFDSSRIFLNIEELQALCIANLKEDFERYISLRESSLPDVSGIKEALTSLVSEGELQAKKIEALLEPPKTEADRFLVELVRRIYNEFLHNPSYGLNAFLSLRIRHGSLAGHLRGPLEEQSVIAKKGSSGEYLNIDEWNQICSELPAPKQAVISDAFRSFSRQFDEKINWFIDNVLQIRSEAKPSGAFDIPISVIFVNSLKAALASDPTTELLVKICTDEFKDRLNSSLHSIRRQIGQGIRGEIDQYLQDLMESVRTSNSGGQLIQIEDALTAARTKMAIATGRVSDWFAQTDYQSGARSYSIQQTVDIARRLTTNVRPKFDLQIDLDVANGFPVMQGAFRVADALFIAFDNVYLHAGLEGEVKVSVRADLPREGRIGFVVENRLGDAVDCDALTSKLEQIQARLASGDFRDRLAAEGGTGLYKLKKLVDPDSDGRGSVDFKCADRQFSLSFTMPARMYEKTDE